MSEDDPNQQGYPPEAAALLTGLSGRPRSQVTIATVPGSPEDQAWRFLDGLGERGDRLRLHAMSRPDALGLSQALAGLFHVPGFTDAESDRARELIDALRAIRLGVRSARLPACR